MPGSSDTNTWAAHKVLSYSRILFYISDVNLHISRKLMYFAVLPIIYKTDLSKSIHISVCDHSFSPKIQNYLM